MKAQMYLNYGGNCGEAFRFYEKHLGGKIVFMMTHAEAPDAPKDMPEKQRDSILHAKLRIGETELLASDVPGGNFQPMRSAYVALSVDSIPEAERIHALFADGGEIFMPMQETFFAHRFGMVRDRFGTSWMVLHERAPQPA